MRSRLWLVLLLLLVLSVPTFAYAEENTLTKEEVERLEQTEIVRNGNTRAITPMTRIRDFFFNVRLGYAGTTFGLFQLDVVMPAFLRNNKAWIYVPPVLIVFLWWGVRKVIRMIFRAFRKGKINA